MGKTQKYTDDQLLEAVIRYSEEYKGKIIATRLAEWSRKNMDGMQDVTNYMFTRPKTVTAPNGKQLKIMRPCTKRMNEINARRSITTAVRNNPLLRSANIDDFLYLTNTEQREIILGTRRQVEQLTKENAYVLSENAVLQATNKEQSIKLEELQGVLTEIQERQEWLTSRLDQITAEICTERSKAVLAQIGITDKGFDLNQYRHSLQQDIEHAFSIQKAISESNSRTLGIKDTEQDPGQSELDLLLEGLDFDE